MRICERIVLKAIKQQPIYENYRLHMLAIAVIAADERAYKNPVQRIMTGIYDYYTTVGLVVAIRSDYKIPTTRRS